MKSVVLAEKPSVARDIARVLKCSKKNKRGAGRKSICGNLGSGASGYFGRTLKNMIKNIKNGRWKICL